MLESLANDAKFALRRLLRRRTYTALTVLTLALGVAGTAAVSGIARRMLLEPLPVRDEKEVVAFWFDGNWSETKFLAVRPVMDGFRSVAAYYVDGVTLRSGDAPARLLKAVEASAELFDVLGVRPALGSGFRRGDDRVGAEPVVVISHSLWRELGGRPTILGQRLELSGQSRTVVGVMPEGFWFPDPGVRLWLCDDMNPQTDNGMYNLIGRLAPGKRIEAMGPQLQTITRVLDERFDFPADWDLTMNPALTPLRERLLGNVRPSVLALLVAMSVILLVACVNVAALMLGQLDSRGTEMAMRSALGAGRKRLLQQLAVESLAIGALAGVVGAALAAFGFPFLSHALPLGALAETARLDWTLFAAAMAVALVASTLIALAPSFALAQHDLQGTLAKTRTGGIGSRGGRLEHGLVVGQVALVVLLAAGAALLIRSVENRRAIKPGVDVNGVAVLDVMLPASIDPARTPALLRELVATVAALPGVESAAATQRLPLRGSSDNWGIRVEGRPELRDATTAFRTVTPEYFHTMRIRLVSGRLLLDTDRVANADEGVVVVNQALARKFLPGRDPIGQRIAFMRERWDRIVGVVDDVAEAGLSTEPVPARYSPYEQVPWLSSSHSLVLRLRPGVDPAAILTPARRAIQAAAPSVAVYEQTTMASVLSQAVGPVLQVMALLSLLAGLALVLGAVGIYGVISHFATRRKRDWSIRMVLGMRPALVVGKIVGRGGALVGAGLALGLVAFVVAARLLASFLYGVGTADPLALAGAAAVLIAAGLVAAAVPARRASRVDPAVVLRES
ncbi:MAG TPA: ADOP family duplicated permease [Thermoanaerobaculia bacterium]|jgi:predicted permease|nr:ADOP family duplicated permease [Thermoanaerobaculia bacterium]